jgi:4-hydroxyphenylacetate 3-monooxygenase oxygenase component
MGVRSGAEYIRGLRDRPREVWVNGERVSDVANHPAFAGPISAVASLYDLQCCPELQDILTYCPPGSATRTAFSFSQPQSLSCLQRRRAAFKVFADATFGMLGRSPDFLNSALMAFAASKAFVGQAHADYAANLDRHYLLCREDDSFSAHAVINPAVDRTKQSSQHADPSAHLRVVSEDDFGITVEGAKMISTLAPIADELLVFPLPGLAAGDEAYAMAFSVPVSAPGLQLICRTPFNTGTRTLFEHPMSARFEEMDATCIFNNVRIPWERVFLHNNIELANQFYDATRGRHHTGHQGVVRGLAKAELLVGTAIRLAKMARTDRHLHIQEMLGEVLGYLQLTEAAIGLCEAKATSEPSGLISPAIEPIQTLRYQFPRWCQRMIDVIHKVGGGSLMATPSAGEFNSAIGHVIERYFRAIDAPAEERVRIIKLAWDITGDSFGQRQQLYEYFHAGDPVRLAAMQYAAYDAGYLADRVACAIQEPVHKPLGVAVGH